MLTWRLLFWLSYMKLGLIFCWISDSRWQSVLHLQHCEQQSFRHSRHRRKPSHHLHNGFPWSGNSICPLYHGNLVFTAWLLCYSSTGVFWIKINACCFGVDHLKISVSTLMCNFIYREFPKKNVFKSTYKNNIIILYTIIYLYSVPCYLWLFLRLNFQL